jgi:hypothetical protein
VATIGCVKNMKRPQFDMVIDLNGDNDE